MHRGYVKLWRMSLESGLLQNAEAWQLMTWCLLKATHKSRKQVVGKQFVILEPGQFVFGRKKATQELKTSEQKIRTSLKLLENVDFLTIKSTNKFSVITIVNWGIYQQDQPTNNQQPNQQATNNQPTINHKQTCKELKTCEEEQPLPPDGGDRDPLEKFTPEIIDFVKTFNGYIDGKFEKSAPKRTDKSFVADCNSIRLAISIDGFSLEDIKSSLRWAHGDAFWQDQIKSLSQIRKKGPDGTSKLQKIYEKAKVTGCPRPQMTFSQAAQGERCKEIG